MAARINKKYTQKDINYIELSPRPVRFQFIHHNFAFYFSLGCNLWSRKSTRQPKKRKKNNRTNFIFYTSSDDFHFSSHLPPAGPLLRPIAALLFSVYSFCRPIITKQWKRMWVAFLPVDWVTLFCVHTQFTIKKKLNLRESSTFLASFVFPNVRGKNCFLRKYFHFTHSHNGIRVYFYRKFGYS